LKVVAGTPDFDDWEHIKIRQEQLIEEENRQIGIISKIQEQLNTVTESLNKIYKSDETDGKYLYETILAENRTIITDLENLLLTLTLAKIDLISPSILNNIDIKDLLNEHLTNISVANI